MRLWLFTAFAVFALSTLAICQASSSASDTGAFDTGNGTGLPVYPGAKPSEHSDGRGTVSLSDQTQVHRVAASAYLSSDKPEKVLDFYRKRLKSSGQLVECAGGKNTEVDVQLDEASFSAPEACVAENFAGTELKIASRGEQRIVVVLPQGSGSEIALVSVKE